METSRDTNLAIFASLLVLFSAMLDPRITMALAAICLVVLPGHQWLESKGHRLDSKKLFHWLPRLLAICFIGFVSLFALDVFGAYESAGETFLALLIHLIPSYVLLAVTILAWYKPFWGGLVFVLLGLLSTLIFNTYIFAVIAILIGLLFHWDTKNEDKGSSIGSQASQF
jgi:hypothetical protein